VASSCGAWTRRSTFGRSRRRAVALTAAFFLSPLVARAQHHFRAEIFGGAAWSLPTTLTIDQADLERLSVDADWETRPFDSPPYYAARIGLWRESRGWELQLLHHKLYLADPPPEIEHFEISHGWNFLTLQRASRTRVVDWRVGAGPVITHVEGRIRGRGADPGGGLFDAGYHVSGAALLAGAGRSFAISRTFFASAEAQVTLSWARVPIQTGHARTANAAFHVLFGFGLGL
jgi:hypothetical protein